MLVLNTYIIITLLLSLLQPSYPHITLHFVDLGVINVVLELTKIDFTY